jgi:hypothetical protein
VTAPRMRAGNSDRQQAVDGLTRHFTEGRLDGGEFDERVGKAYAATHLDELPALFADLPEDLPRRGHGSGVRRPDPDSSGAVGPVRSDRPAGPVPCRGRPNSSSTGHRGSWLCSGCWRCCSDRCTGCAFPLPLIWIAFALLFMARGGRRRRWADSASYNNRC